MKSNCFFFTFLRMYERNKRDKFVNTRINFSNERINDQWFIFTIENGIYDYDWHEHSDREKRALPLVSRKWKNTASVGSPRV